jgi:hypothetical protein
MSLDQLRFERIEQSLWDGFEKLIVDEVKAAAADKLYKTKISNLHSNKSFTKTTYHSVRKELSRNKHVGSGHMTLKRQKVKEEQEHILMLTQQQSYKKMLLVEAKHQAQLRSEVEQSILERRERSQVTKKLREDILKSIETKSIEVKAILYEKDKLSKKRLEELEGERKSILSQRKEELRDKLENVRKQKLRQEQEVSIMYGYSYSYSYTVGTPNECMVGT